MQGTVDNDIDSGVPQAALLLEYCDAAVGRREDLPQRREAVRAELGEAAAVDAAATIANYQRMVRIADGCGIPLDEMTKSGSEGWRETLGLHHYRSSTNTPA